MHRLQIAELCKDSRVFRSDGARLRQVIEKHWDSDQPIVLDFSGVRIASVSFFDESIGMLALTHPLEELTRRIQVDHMDPPDRMLLNSIVSARASERQKLPSRQPASVSKPRHKKPQALKRRSESPESSRPPHSR
jgi:hypothetical protein